MKVLYSKVLWARLEYKKETCVPGITDERVKEIADYQAEVLAKVKAFRKKLERSLKRKRVLSSVHLGTAEGTVGVHTVNPVKRKKVA